MLINLLRLNPSSDLIVTILTFLIENSPETSKIQRQSDSISYCSIMLAQKKDYYEGIMLYLTLAFTTLYLLFNMYTGVIVGFQLLYDLLVSFFWSGVVISFVIQKIYDLKILISVKELFFKDINLK